jgi:hypothetical protein
MTTCPIIFGQLASIFLKHSCFDQFPSDEVIFEFYWPHGHRPPAPGEMTPKKISDHPKSSIKNLTHRKLLFDRWVFVIITNFKLFT